MTLLLTLSGFLIGAILGGYLTVMIPRLATTARGEALTWRDILAITSRRESLCESCGHVLGWRDKLPIAGYFLVRGHCRHCDAGIPGRFPLIELGAATFLAAWMASGPIDAATGPDMVAEMLVQLGLGGALILGYGLARARAPQAEPFLIAAMVASLAVAATGGAVSPVEALLSVALTPFFFTRARFAALFAVASIAWLPLLTTLGLACAWYGFERSAILQAKPV